MADAKRQNASSLLYVDPYTLDDLQATMQAGWEEVAKLAETLCTQQGTGRSSFGLEGRDDEAFFDAKAKRGQANKAIVEMQLGEQLTFSSVADEFHTQLMRRVIATEIAHLSPDGKFRYSQIIEAITCRIGDAADALETVWGSELGLLQMLSEALASSSDGYEAVRRLAVSVDDKCLATFLKTNPPVPQEEQEVFRLLAWACQSERNRREAFWEIAVSVYLRPRVSQLRLILKETKLLRRLPMLVKSLVTRVYVRLSGNELVRCARWKLGARNTCALLAVAPSPCAVRGYERVCESEHRQSATNRQWVST